MDPAKTKSRLVYKHDGTYYAAALDRKARRLYAGSSDYAIHVFDLPTLEPATEPPKKNEPEKKDAKAPAPKFEPVARWTKHDNYVSALAWVERTGTLVSGGYDGQLIWWDAAPRGEALPDSRSRPAETRSRAVAGHAGWVRALTATPDGALVISAGDDMLVKLWDAASGKLVRTLEGHAKTSPQHFVTAIYALAVSPDGKHLASADRIGVVRVWEIATGKTVQQFQVPILYTFDPRQRKRSIGGIRSVAFSPDGRHLAVGGIGQVGNVDGFEGPAHLELWDWARPQKVFATGLEGQKGILNHLAFDPSGTWLIGAGGGNGGLLGFWKVKPLPAPSGGDEKPAPDDKKPKERKEPEVPAQRVKFDGHIHDFCLSADAKELYAVGHGKVEVWGLEG
jgi:WD40 repeat protein